MIILRSMFAEPPRATMASPSRHHDGVFLIISDPFDPDPVERIHFDPPPKPSHKLSPLERAQQGRAARRDMIGRTR